MGAIAGHAFNSVANISRIALAIEASHLIDTYRMLVAIIVYVMVTFIYITSTAPTEVSCVVTEAFAVAGNTINDSTIDAIQIAICSIIVRISTCNT
jgi:hypothetical protein